MKKNVPAEMEGICDRIRELAMERGLGKMELSRKAQISDRIVYLIMQKKANLRDKTIASFARALDTSPTYLLTGVGEKNLISNEIRSGEVSRIFRDRYRRDTIMTEKGADIPVPTSYELPCELNTLIEFVAKILKVQERIVADHMAEIISEKIKDSFPSNQSDEKKSKNKEIKK